MLFIVPKGLLEVKRLNSTAAGGSNQKGGTDTEVSTVGKRSKSTEGGSNPGVIETGTEGVITGRNSPVTCVDPTRPRSDEMIRAPRERDTTRPRSAEHSPVLHEQLEVRMTRTGILDRESLLGIPSSKLIRRSPSTLNPTSTSSSSPQDFSRGAAHDVEKDNNIDTKPSIEVNNNEKSQPPGLIHIDDDLPSPRLLEPVSTADDEISTPLPLQSNVEQPLKRRPGRPPGSTKKFKPQLGEEMKRDHSSDVFSLRKFFEAGGRDYNEYLEWLKKKQAVTSRYVRG